MPLPLAAALGIGAGLNLLGGIFGNKSKNKAAKADLANQQAMADYQAALRNRQDEADEQRRVLRGSMFRGLASALGIGNLIPTDYSRFSTTLRPGIQAPRLQYGGTGQSLAGDIFGTLGSTAISGYLANRYENAAGGGFRPATEAAARGELYGPPENPYNDFGAFGGDNSVSIDPNRSVGLPDSY